MTVWESPSRSDCIIRFLCIIIKLFIMYKTDTLVSLTFCGISIYSIAVGIENKILASPVGDLLCVISCDI